MRTFKCACLLLTLVAAADTARADVTFSNVVISGSLAGGATYNTGATDIDFLFPNATVGDPVDPLRFGNIIITYIAESSAGMVQDSMTLSLLGALSGSGMIIFNEVIEDLIGSPVPLPVTLATYGTTLNASSVMPHVAVLNFSRPSSRIKVKKTLVFTAVNTPAFDFANISLIEQNLRQVPEPATLGLLALGAPALLRRRRRRAS